MAQKAVDPKGLVCPVRSEPQQSQVQSPVQSPQPEPRTREDFLQYSTDFSLDTNTAHSWLCLSQGNRRVTITSEEQECPDHPDRFTVWGQVLSRETVTGRGYFELEWSGDWAEVAVSYGDIERKGSDKCEFGWNDKSWALVCRQTDSRFWYDSVQAQPTGPGGSRIGVFLDHTAVSFYSVGEDMRLIHREQTAFTRPLHAGIRLGCTGDTAYFPKL